MTPLKRWLFEHEKTNRWIARELKIDETAVSQIANGKRFPTLKLAFRICRITETNMEDMWSYVDEERDE